MPCRNLLSLLLLSLASLAHPQTAPPPLPRSSKVAIFVTGETFRAHSQQNSREVGVEGYEPQREAVQAQLSHLFEPLHQVYTHVAVWLETSATPWSANLTSWYGPYLSAARTRLKEPESSEDKTMESRMLVSFDSVLSVVFEFEAVLVMRADLVPKPLFGCALVAAPREKILLPFILNKNTLDLPPQLRARYGKNVDRVCDTFVWLPRWTFEAELVDVGKLFMSHYALIHAVPTYGPDRIAYVFPWGQFDSDPAKSRNPLYGLSARAETQELNEFAAASINVTCADVQYAVESHTMDPRSTGLDAGFGLVVPSAPRPPGGD